MPGVSSIDNQTVLAVQSLLDSQAVTNDTAPVPEDEDDVFQCGKCKKSFNCLQLFMAHKKTCLVPTTQAITISSADPTSSGVTSLSNTQSQATTIQFPGSPMSQINQGLVLSEADLLSLNLETPTSLPPTHILAHQQISPSASSHVQQQTLLTNSLASVAGNQQPILINSIASTPVNVINEATVSIDPSGTLTVNGSNDKVSTFVIKQPVQTVVEQQKFAEDDQSNKEAIIIGTDKENDSTVNIITEFHSSMVMKPKRTAAEKGPVATSSTADDASGDVDGAPPKKEKLKCAYCNKTFTKNFDLQQHIRSHTGEKPYQCIVCGRAFAQKSNVKKHMQSHKVWPDGLTKTLPKQPLEKTNEDGTTCSENPETSDQQSDKSSNTTVAGISVNATYDDSGNVHIVVDNSYVCPYCDFNSKTYPELKTHMRVHSSEKVYKCIMKECGQTFPELDPYLEHIKMHENEMNYCCHLCQKSFSSLYDLGVHQYSHSLFPNQGPRPGPKYYRCVKCLNKYTTSAALEHHMATTSHRYPCTCCSKVFTCERYLRRHLLVHGTVALNKCNVCSKCFKTEHYLKMHKLIHTGDKPFKCPVCAKSFNRRDKLKRHNLTHIPFKRFKCPFHNHTGCMKEFNRPDKLKDHILTHSGLKPYKCKKCPRYFSRRSHLRDHERFHNDDVPFQCDKCHKKFIRERRFKEHNCKVASSPADASKSAEDGAVPTKRKRGKSQKNQSPAKNPNKQAIESENVVEVHLGVGSNESDFVDIPSATVYENTPLQNSDDLPETTTIVVTSTANHSCSVDCLHLQYDQSQEEPIIIHHNADMLTSEQQCFDQSRSSELTVVEEEVDYSQHEQFTLTPLKNDLKSQDDVQVPTSYQAMTNVEPEVTELALTYSDDVSKQQFVQFQCDEGDGSQCGSMQLTLNHEQDQHFTIIQTDENGKVKHMDCGPVILKVATPPKTNDTSC